MYRSRTPAPLLAKAYWRLKEGATLEDVVAAVRAGKSNLSRWVLENLQLTLCDRRSRTPNGESQTGKSQS